MTRALVLSFLILCVLPARAAPFAMEEFVSPAGLKIWLSPDAKAEDVSVVARFHGGAYSDDIPGTTVMAETIMALGTPEKGPVPFWSALSGMGAACSIN